MVAFIVLGCCALLITQEWLHRRDRREWQHQLTSAHDRLFAAHKDGFLIPPADPEDEPEVPLSVGLEDYLDDYDEAGRAAWQGRINTLRTDGLDDANIERRLRRERGELPA